MPFRTRRKNQGLVLANVEKKRICGQWYDKTETDSKEQQQDNTEKDDNKEIREQEMMDEVVL